MNVLFSGFDPSYFAELLKRAGIQNVFFGVSARDPLTYGVVVALIRT